MRLPIMAAQRYKRSSCKRWVNRERTPLTLDFIILGVGWLVASRITYLAKEPLWMFMPVFARLGGCYDRLRAVVPIARVSVGKDSSVVRRGEKARAWTKAAVRISVT